MKIKFVFLAGFLIAGCNVVESSGGKNHSSDNVNQISNERCVSVYTLGDVVNAVVTDNKNQIAEFNSTFSNYCFKLPINYPVSVKVLNDTFIDVDYDNKKTANDIKPKFTVLKSYFNYIDLITDMHARAVDENMSVYASEKNSTVIIPSLEEVKNYYAKMIEDKYNISFNPPLNKVTSSDNEKILNFAAYDYNLSKTLDIKSNLFDDYNNLVIFFNNDLNKPSIKDKVKYYSFFHSLELLNQKLIQRVDNIHKPQITYLHPDNMPVSESFVSFKNNLISKDIKTDISNNVYVASGKDGVTKLNSYLDFVINKKVNNTFSNAYNLDILKTDTRNYLFVADGGEGVDVFNILGGNFVPLNKIFWKYYDAKADKEVPITIDDTKGLSQIDEVISVKSYVSPFGKTKWFSFGTRKTGLYLVDFNKIIPALDSNVSFPVIVFNPTNDINNTLLIPGDGGTVYSEAFSSDGENIYATKDNTIERYDLSSLPVALSGTYSIKGDNAYNLKMINYNGVDELFVSTNKGVELYNVQNNSDLSFISSYDTEGAQSGYLPKINFISEKNILLFTDGYKGLKAIKYDISSKPRLCGTGYFSPYSDKTKLAKVTSVEAYKNNTDGEYYVIVGIEGFGVAEFKLNDLLFKHCQ